MIEGQDRRDATKWIERIFRAGASRNDLHGLVDGALDGLLSAALREASSERQRADIAVGVANRAHDELVALRQGLAALGDVDSGGRS